MAGAAVVVVVSVVVVVVVVGVVVVVVVVVGVVVGGGGNVDGRYHENVVVAVTGLDTVVAGRLATRTGAATGTAVVVVEVVVVPVDVVTARTIVLVVAETVGTGDDGSEALSEPPKPRLRTATPATTMTAEGPAALTKTFLRFEDLS